MGARVLFTPLSVPGCLPAAGAGWVPCHAGERQDSAWDRAGAGMQGMEWPRSQQYPTKRLCKGYVAAGLFWVEGSYRGPPILELLWLWLFLPFK